MSRPKKRQAREKAGRRAERIAAWYLRVKGYQILARRYQSKVGEIDLIAKKGTDLVCVEVKQRATLKEAEDALTYQTRKRVSSAAKLYYSRYRSVQNLGLRFDAVLLARGWKLRHIQDAWRID